MKTDFKIMPTGAVCVLMLMSGIACTDEVRTADEADENDTGFGTQESVGGGTHTVEGAVIQKHELINREVTVFGFLMKSTAADGSKTYRLVSQREMMSESIGESLDSISIRLSIESISGRIDPDDCVGDFVRARGVFSTDRKNPVMTIGENGMIISHSGSTRKQCTIKAGIDHRT